MKTEDKLQELQSEWSQISPTQKDRNILSERSLIANTNRKYKREWLKVIIPEILLSLLYAFLMIFLLSFFQTFQTFTLKVIAIFSMTLLILIPILNIRGLFAYRLNYTMDSPVNTMLEKFRKKAMVYRNSQKYLLGLNIVLSTCLVILLPLIYSEHLDQTELIISITISVLIVVFASSRIWKYYFRRIQKMKSILGDLQ